MAAAQRVDGVHRHDDEDDADGKGDQQGRKAAKAAEDVPQGQKGEDRHPPAGEAQRPLAVEPLAALPAADGVDGGEGADAPGAEGAEGDDHRHDEDTAEQVEEDPAAPGGGKDDVFAHPLQKEVAEGDAGEEAGGRPRQGDGQVFDQVEAADLAGGDADGLHDADFAVLLLQGEGDGEAEDDFTLYHVYLVR